jgi:hypothetical protein
VKYKIEKDVPIKGPLYNLPNRKYPFAYMDVGDSFAFDPDEFLRVRHAAHTAGTRYRKQFVVSRLQNRVWRKV